MTRKAIKPTVVLPTILKSDYNNFSYPIDMVKEVYVKSDQGMKGFCRRFGLAEADLRRQVEAGGWDTLRDKYRERIYGTMVNNRLSSLEIRQDVIHRMERMELIGIETFMDDMEHQYTTKGDLFIRDDSGEIRRDDFGNPLIRKVPWDFKKALKDTQDIREENTAILVEATRALLGEKESEKPATIDLEKLAAGNDE